MPDSMTAVCRATSIASVALLMRAQELVAYVRAHPVAGLEPGGELPDAEEVDFLAGILDHVERVADAEAGLRVLGELHAAVHLLRGTDPSHDDTDAERLLRSVFEKEPTDD